MSELENISRIAIDEISKLRKENGELLAQRDRLLEACKTMESWCTQHHPQVDIKFLSKAIASVKGNK